MGGCNANKEKTNNVESFEPHVNEKQYNSIENMEVEMELNQDVMSEHVKETNDKKGCKDCKDCENCEDCEDCNKEGRTNMDKWRYTLITTVLFFIVVNPYTYKFVNFLLKRFFKIADKSGCPTFAGVLVHTVVFTLLLRGLMEMKL